MKSFLQILIFFLFISQTSYSQWYTQLDGTQNPLVGVSFTDSANGTAVGHNGTIVRTTDGGENWIMQTIGSHHLLGVSFTDANTGTVVGDSGTILRTTDGGTTWDPQTSGTTNTLRDVSFTDIYNGWAVGYDGTIVRTTDGGENWDSLSSETTSYLYDVSFPDTNNGWAVGEGGTIVRTTNGGTTWTDQTSGTTSWLSGVSFTDANNGTTVGTNGTILRTTNGGENWDSLSSGITNHLEDVSFIDENTGTAVGVVGTIFRTTNGGATWISQSSGTTNNLRGVSFTDANNGTAVGGIGSPAAHIILRTTNGGVTPVTTITEPVHFPFQDENSTYLESQPIYLANGNILMVWTSSDSIYSAQSSDGGLTWGTQDYINQTISSSNPRYLTGLRTNTGRVIVTWQALGGLEMCYSDNNGSNWSAPNNITLDGNDRYTTISQTQDGKLWLFYNRYSINSERDIYYRTSIDNGNTWDVETIFSQTPGDESYGTIVSGSGPTILAVYQKSSNGDYGIYSTTSTDGGVTWSAPTQIVNSSFNEERPRVLRQSDGTLWMIYELSHPAPTLTTFWQYDLYYTQSFDGGNSWTSPTAFTQYAQVDRWHNTDLVNNQPFVSFHSYRFRSFLGFLEGHLWYGIIGVTQDTNPPPAVFAGNASIPAPNINLPVLAYVDDETGITDVQLSYDFNGTTYGPLQMFDDGMHDDENAGDNIWGVSIGTFQLGDFIEPSFTVTDANANTISVSVSGFNIIPVHFVGNLILSLGAKSQLAELTAIGHNAHWPRVNGNDYLSDGGLWIGNQVMGENRVMDWTYNTIDWNQTTGSNITIDPGKSEQDISVTYDDSLSLSSPIGLLVHQQSYQWSGSTRDDFIILTYTIKNTGLNGNLTDIFAAVWLDPDLGFMNNALNDLGGYDSQRSMLYMFDSQGNPSGYIGLKLLGLGNIPHTANLWGYPGTTDPSTDLERYQYMTSGFPSIPSDPRDYRMLLTAQPFSIASGDSQTEAFGIVMGDGLSELQANADTMEAIYNSITTFLLSVPVTDGWNMVSVPGINPAGMGVTDWWSGKDPGANVFKYSGGYISVTNSTPTEGYWMKNAGAQVYNYPAIQIVAHADVPLAEGWNLIGLYENTEPTATLQTSPPGIITTTIYEYSGGYLPAANIVPGYGYWVKSDVVGGSIVGLTAPSLGKGGGEVVEYFKEDWGKIILTDAAGIVYTLYAVKGEVDLNKYELPPLPPTGMFDIRYGSGMIAEDINSSIQTIDMSGVTYPLTVRVEGMDMRLMDESGKTVNVNLKSGEDVVISDATVQKLMVTAELIPAVYALEQNYPNPFNPVTQIKYGIPKPERVELTIFNVLGERIVTLVNEKQEAGYYTVEWNGSNVSSGVYLYAIKAGDNFNVKKMILLK